MTGFRFCHAAKRLPEFFSRFSRRSPTNVSLPRDFLVRGFWLRVLFCVDFFAVGFRVVVFLRSRAIFSSRFSRFFPLLATFADKRFLAARLFFSQILRVFVIFRRSTFQATSASACRVAKVDVKSPALPKTRNLPSSGGANRRQILRVKAPALPKTRNLTPSVARRESRRYSARFTSNAQVAVEQRSNGR